MEALRAIAPLFDYPDQAYAGRALGCALGSELAALQAFAERIAGMSVARLQESFIETFDMNPAATLEIGWHIFGEQYERGDLLVMLRQRLRDAGIPETTELPDHLLHVLPLVAAMDPDERNSFVERYLAPALEKIANAVPEASPFADLVRAVRDMCGSAIAPAGARHE